MPSNAIRLLESEEPVARLVNILPSQITLAEQLAARLGQDVDAFLEIAVARALDWASAEYVPGVERVREQQRLREQRRQHKQPRRRRVS